MIRSFGGCIIAGIVLAALALFAHGEVNGQTAVDSNERVVRFSRITVQGEEIPESEWSQLVIAQSDTIRFYYWCDNRKAPREPFLFRTKIARDLGYEQEQEKNSKSSMFGGLPEDQYEFSVSAFAPARWETAPALIRFLVNDAEARTARALREARKQRIADSLQALREAEARRQEEEMAERSNRTILLVAAVAVLFVFVGVTIFLWRRLRKTKPEHSAQVQSRQHVQPSLGNGMDKNGDASVEKLLKENGALRAEIAALRGQIEALQERSSDLQKTNKELQDQREKMLEHKNQLDELQTQKDELFAMVVHDIKNPAGIIKGLVELLRSYDLTATEQNEIMEELMSTSGKILELAQEVSRVLALESGTLKLDLARYDFTQVMDDVCRRNGRAAGTKDIKIVKDIGQSVGDVEMDVQKIEEVLDNLVSNAVKFSHKGAIVQVVAIIRGARLQVEVIDNGLGLSEDDVKRAFGRGVRLSAQPTGGETSSGLGLWIVKRIIEAHHGRVWLKSALGKGSTFAFELPLEQPQAEAVQ